MVPRFRSVPAQRYMVSRILVSVMAIRSSASRSLHPAMLTFQRLLLSCSPPFQCAAWRRLPPLITARARCALLAAGIYIAIVQIVAFYPPATSASCPFLRRQALLRSSHAKEQPIRRLASGTSAGIGSDGSERKSHHRARFRCASTPLSSRGHTGRRMQSRRTWYISRRASPALL